MVTRPGRQPSTRTGTCPVCRRTVTLTPTRGKLNPHNDPHTGRRCTGWRFGNGDPVVTP